MTQPGPPYTAFPQYTAAAKRPFPPTVQRAVLLMRVGGALTVANGLGTVLLGGSSSTGGAAYDVGYMVVYLALAGLWLWMAQANRAGKNGARIISTVFFGFSCLVLLGDLVDLAGAAQRGGVVLMAFAVACLSWAVGLFTVILLWHKQSALHFKSIPMPYPAYWPDFHRPVSQPNATMQSIPQQQSVSDPWSVPDDHA